MSKLLLESLLPVSVELVQKISENTILYESHNTEMLEPNNDTLYAAVNPVDKVKDEIAWFIGQNELVDRVY